MSTFSTPAHRMTLFPGQRYRRELPDLVTAFELAYGDDGMIDRTFFVVDTTAAPNTEISGVFHILLSHKKGEVTTRSGRYAVAGDGRNKMLWITRTFLEWDAPIQSTMPHAWLAALDPLPPLHSPAPQQVASLAAAARHFALQPSSPQLQDLYTRITDIDPWHNARASRAAVAWLPVHLAQFVAGARISIPRLVYASGKPHPEPVTVVQRSGDVVIVTACDGQGLALRTADLRSAEVI